MVKRESLFIFAILLHTINYSLIKTEKMFVYNDC